MQLLSDNQLKIRRLNTFCDIPGCSGIHIPNVPLMRKIMDQIRAVPESWDQDSWVNNHPNLGLEYDPVTDRMLNVSHETAPCETSFCIAGHAAMLSDDPLFSYRWGNQHKSGIGYKNYTVSGLPARIRATHELGLTTFEADQIFDGRNDWQRIKRLVRQIFGEDL